MEGADGGKGREKAERRVGRGSWALSRWQSLSREADLASGLRPVQGAHKPWRSWRPSPKATGDHGAPPAEADPQQRSRPHEPGCRAQISADRGRGLEEGWVPRGPSQAVLELSSGCCGQRRLNTLRASSLRWGPRGVCHALRTASSSQARQRHQHPSAREASHQQSPQRAFFNGEQPRRPQTSWLGEGPGGWAVGRRLRCCS